MLLVRVSGIGLLIQQFFSVIDYGKYILNFKFWQFISFFGFYLSSQVINSPTLWFILQIVLYICSIHLIPCSNVIRLNKKLHLMWYLSSSCINHQFSDQINVRGAVSSSRVIASALFRCLLSFYFMSWAFKIFWFMALFIATRKFNS